MRIVGVVPGAKLFGSEDLYADHYLFVNGYRSASPPAAARRSASSAATALSFRRRSRSAIRSSSAAARAFIPIIFKSWNTRPDLESPCSASASVCR